MTTKEKFWKNITKREGCWEWPTHRNGYGSFRIGAKNYLAHRIAYELTYGKIPKGKLICHHCDNCRCVRPDHLFLGTQKDNIADAMSKGRMSNQYVGRTHCSQGHEYSVDGFYWRTPTSRACRICLNRRRQAWRLRERAKGNKPS